MRAYAGDLEPGDRILSGQYVMVVETARPLGESVSVMLRRDARIYAVSDHPESPDRVLLKLSGQSLDVHRARVLKITEGKG